MNLIINYVQYAFYFVCTMFDEFSNYILLPQNNYLKMIVYFYILVFMEQHILFFKRGKTNLKETITSLNHGIFYESCRLFTHKLEVPVYFFIYEGTGKMILSKFNEEEAFIWIACCIGFIATDFCYYWVHRLKHEVHLLWIFHQVHHSSELFELPVGVRQSVVELLYDFIFYIPLALFINPYYIIMSRELIYLYQIFMHTEIINKLGPLEWIFNTPNHHRVHHAGNKYCLDKNYGGVLIIWDRIFSTFKEEQKHIKMFYGLPVSPKSYHVLYQQISGIMNLLTSHSHMIFNKKYLFRIFFNGPRWTLNAPRLGYEKYKRVRDQKNDKDKSYAGYWNFHYVCFSHYVIVLNGLEVFAAKDMNLMQIIRAFENMFISFSSYGYFFDNYEFEGILISFLRYCILFATCNNFSRSFLNVYIKIFLFHEGFYILIAFFHVFIQLIRDSFKADE